MITPLHISLISLFSLSMLFHIMVLVKVIPYAIVWGGRLKSDAEMYRFEIVSLILNGFFLFVILLKSKVLWAQFPENRLTPVLWIMVALFALNTVGNILSKTYFERIVFTALTLLITILTLMLVLKG